MKDKISQFVIYIIVLGIIVGTYLETGFFTSLAITILFLTEHYDRKIMSKITELIRDIVKQL